MIGLFTHTYVRHNIDEIEGKNSVVKLYQKNLFKYFFLYVVSKVPIFADIDTRGQCSDR
jgi:hypothetical protein